MHELDFVDAEGAIKDLIMEYFEKQEIVVDLDQLFAEDEYEEESQESVQVDLTQILKEQTHDADEEEEEAKLQSEAVADLKNNPSASISNSKHDYDVSHEDLLNVGSDGDDLDEHGDDDQYHDDDVNAQYQWQ